MKRRWFALPLGYRCNNRCRFCGQGDLRDLPSPAPSLSSVEESLVALREDQSTGVSGVWLVGGEPTARDDLPALVGLARKAGFERVGVQSNGRRLAYPGYRKDLLESGLTDLEISLHGSSAACHDHLAQVPGAFGQTLQGLRSVAGGALQVSIAQVLDRSNFRHVGELLRLAHRLGVRRVRWAFPESFGGVTRDSRRLGPRLALLGPRLQATAGQGKSLGIALTLSGVPDCHRPQGFDRGPSVAAPSSRSFAQICETCPARPTCVGLSPGYAAHHGLHELTRLEVVRPDAFEWEAPGLIDVERAPGSPVTSPRT